MGRRISPGCEKGEWEWVGMMLGSRKRFCVTGVNGSWEVQLGWIRRFAFLGSKQESMSAWGGAELKV